MAKPISPASPEAKARLLHLLPYDGRAMRRHILVFNFVLDWWHEDYGDALASVRHVADRLAERSAALPHGKPLSRTQVHEALGDLVAWGYLSRQLGRGRSASRYVPAWNLVCVPSVPDATEADPCVLPAPDTGVLPVPDTTEGSVRHVGDEDPPYPTRATDRGTGEEGASVAHHRGDGLAATPDGGAAGFDELYDAYGVRVQRAKAKAEYERIAPNARLSTDILTAAKRWREAFDREEREPRYRKQLATWLKEERWLEDGPAPRPARKVRAPRGEVVTVVGEPYLKQLGAAEYPAFKYRLSEGDEREHLFFSEDEGAMQKLRDAMPAEADDWDGVQLVLTRGERGKRQFARVNGSKA